MSALKTDLGGANSADPNGVILEASPHLKEFCKVDSETGQIVGHKSGRYFVGDGVDVK